jgi:hypothetical protein
MQAIRDEQHTARSSAHPIQAVHEFPLKRRFEPLCIAAMRFAAMLSRKFFRGMSCD